MQVIVADLDSDGDLDVASVDRNTLKAFENTNGRGQFAQGTLLENYTVDFSRPSLAAADLNGDDLLDIAFAEGGRDSLQWHANLGNFSFGPGRVVTTTARAANYVLAVDIDKDGDIDLVLAAGNDNQVLYYPNLDGKGTFGDGIVVGEDTFRPAAIDAGDLDGDGDEDIVLITSFGESVSVFRNHGDGSFAPEELVSRVGLERGSFVTTEDLDEDGDLDLIATSNYFLFGVIWYENLGNATYSALRPISGSGEQANWHTVADLDADGDLDVVVSDGPNPVLCWYENIDARATFGPRQFIRSLSGESVVAGDLDQDGDLDLVVGAGSSVFWVVSALIGRTPGGPKTHHPSPPPLAQCLALVVEGGRFSSHPGPW